MRKAITFVLFMLVPALFVDGQITPTQTDEKQSVEREVRRLNAEEVGSFLRHDAKALERLWSSSFVVTNPLNKFVTRQQVLAMVESGFLMITFL